MPEKKHLESQRDLTVTSKEAEGFKKLTGREKEVIQLIANGKLAKQIAYELGVSENTLKNHLRSIKEKLGVDNSPEIIRVWMQLGYTSKEEFIDGAGI